MDQRTKNKLHNIYYSNNGMWKGDTAIKKLAARAKVSNKIAKEYLSKQAIWQIYKTTPKYIPRPTSTNSNSAKPNDLHEADLLFLPHDKIGQKTYKYALTVVDVASRYKAAEPLTDKTANQVASAFKKIYKRGPLKFPKTIKVDPGKEFMAAVNILMKDHNVVVQRGQPGNHRAQAIVERFNRTLAERLFSHQYAKEMTLSSGERSTEWVKRLPEVVKALNNEETRLIDAIPKEAIKMDNVPQHPALPPKKGRKVGFEEEVIPGTALVRYLYAPGEVENDERKRATDPIWSLKTFHIRTYTIRENQPIQYYLDCRENDCPKRSFVREELQIVPLDTELPMKLE